MFDVGTGQSTQVAQHDAPIKCVKWIDTPQGGILATGSWDKTLKVRRPCLSHPCSPFPTHRLSARVCSIGTCGSRHPRRWYSSRSAATHLTSCTRSWSSARPSDTCRSLISRLPGRHTRCVYLTVCMFVCMLTAATTDNCVAAEMADARGVVLPRGERIRDWQRRGASGDTVSVVTACLFSLLTSGAVQIRRRQR